MTTTSVVALPPQPVVPAETASTPSAGAQFVVLVERSIQARWRSLVVWTFGLAAICAVQLAVYPSVSSSAGGLKAMLDQYPEALRKAFRLDAYASGPGFLNAELFSMMFPLVLTAVALGAAAAATAGEEERGTADLLFAMPVTRGRVLIAKTISMVIEVAVVAGVATVAVVVGSQLASLSVETVNVLAATLTTTLLGLVFGTLGLLFGVVTGRRAAAIGGALALALAAFLINVLAPMADWLAPWQKASPFYWAQDSDPLSTGANWSMIGLMAAISVALVAVSVAVFDHRDINGR